MSPCSDERPGDREDDLHMREGAALLCAWLKALDEQPFEQDTPSAVSDWWERHKLRDARR